MVVIIIGIVTIVAFFLFNKENKEKINENYFINVLSNNIYNYEEIMIDTTFTEKVMSVSENITIQGIVELNHNGYIYISNCQRWGSNTEFGYEIEEYTSTSIDNKKQKCIDYLTSEEYDTTYVSEGDILICTGDLIKKTTNSNYFDTKDNPIIVLKASDYSKMKNEAIDNNDEVIIGQTYLYTSLDKGYIYLRYEIHDKTYNLPFMVKAYVTEETKISGEIKKGKKAKVKYYTLDTSKKYETDGPNIKEIEVLY